MSGRSKTARTTDAKRRLLLDLKELQGCDELQQTVNAHPEEHNIFVWHCNLSTRDGPFKGTVFHLLLEFPDDYPMSPPGVMVMSPFFSHPNVFGGYDYNSFEFRHLRTIKSQGGVKFICLDMLKKYTTKDTYCGWSRAYSVAGILCQLQSFLFSENVPQDHGGPTSNLSARRSSSRSYSIKRKCGEYKCPRCVHTGQNPSPALCKLAVRDPARTQKVDRRRADREHAELSRSVFGNDLLLNEIMSFLSTKDVIKCRQSSTVMRRIIDRYNIVLGREIRCFFTKESYRNCRLGVGIQVERFDDRIDSVTGKNNAGLPKVITSSMDYLSYSAFNPATSIARRNMVGIRSGVWGEDFNEWLPLILSKAHGKRIQPLLVKRIKELCSPTKLCGSRYAMNSPRRAFAESALNVLSCLMNSMAVSMVDTEEKPAQVDADPWSYSTPKVEVKVSMCEKAVLGYCSFHHILLFLAEKYPHMREIANARVRQFKQDKKARHKRNTRDLGKFLCCLCLSDLGWEDIREELQEEALSRSVLWANRKDELLKLIPKMRDPMGYKMPPAPPASRWAIADLEWRSSGCGLKVGDRVLAAWNADNAGKITRHDLDCVSKMPYYPARIVEALHMSYSWYGVKVEFEGEAFKGNFYFRKLSGQGKGIKPIPPTPRQKIPITDRFFNAQIVGKRLTMFQVYFLLHIGRPSGSSPSDILKMYNDRLGQPTVDMTRKITQAAKRILQVGSWHEYNKMIGMDKATCDMSLSPDRMLTKAKNSIKAAAAKGYLGSYRDRMDAQRYFLSRRSESVRKVYKVDTRSWWAQHYQTSSQAAIGRRTMQARLRAFAKTPATPRRPTTASPPKPRVNYWSVLQSSKPSVPAAQPEMKNQRKPHTPGPVDQRKAHAPAPVDQHKAHTPSPIVRSDRNMNSKTSAVSGLPTEIARAPTTLATTLGLPTATIYIAPSAVTRRFRVTMTGGIAFRRTRDVGDKKTSFATCGQVVNSNTFTTEGGITWIQVAASSEGDQACGWLPVIAPNVQLSEELTTQPAMPRTTELPAPAAPTRTSPPRIQRVAPSRVPFVPPAVESFQPNTTSPHAELQQPVASVFGAGTQPASSQRPIGYRVVMKKGVAYRTARSVLARCDNVAAHYNTLVEGTELIEELNVWWLKVGMLWLPVQSGQTMLAKPVLDTRPQSETSEPAKAMPRVESSESLPAPPQVPSESSEAARVTINRSETISSLDLPELPPCASTVAALKPAEDVPDLCDISPGLVPRSKSSSPRPAWMAPVEMPAEEVFGDEPMITKLELPAPVGHERGWSAPRVQDWDGAATQVDSFHVIVKAGISHRGSRNLGDKLDSVAKFTEKVTGVVEGDWLRLNTPEERWIPMCVRETQLVAIV